jgi:hypothetical protein
LSDVFDDVIQVVEDVFLGDTHDVPSEIPERTVTSRIRPSAIFVVRAVDFDDEADLGASEVHDPMSDDELPPEGEARLRAGEPAPEPLFGAGWREPHGASAIFEQLSASLGDERASKHDNLRESRRSRAPSEEGSRSFRDARVAAAHRASREMAERAARKVRGSKLGARLRRRGDEWIALSALRCFIAPVDSCRRRRQGRT